MKFYRLVLPLLACVTISSVLVFALVPPTLATPNDRLPLQPSPRPTPIGLPSNTPSPPTPPGPTPPPAPPVFKLSRSGALLELRLQLEPRAAAYLPAGLQGLWTIVQWEDAQGEWHDVEGWQGTLDEITARESTKVWWVERDDFNTGPFRWVIYATRWGKALAYSQSFYLPGASGRIVTVEISLEL